MKNNLIGLDFEETQQACLDNLLWLAGEYAKKGDAAMLANMCIHIEGLLDEVQLISDDAQVDDA